MSSVEVIQRSLNVAVAYLYVAVTELQSSHDGSADHEGLLRRLSLISRALDGEAELVRPVG